MTETLSDRLSTVVAASSLAQASELFEALTADADVEELFEAALVWGAERELLDRRARSSLLMELWFALSAQVQ